MRDWLLRVANAIGRHTRAIAWMSATIAGGLLVALGTALATGHRAPWVATVLVLLLSASTASTLLEQYGRAERLTRVTPLVVAGVGLVSLALALSQR